MKLNKIYINEAKRIRKVYLNNLLNIVKKEDELKVFFNMIQNIKKEVDDKETESDEYYIKKLLEINDNIESIKEHILPYYNAITQLNTDQKVLYNNIKEKYPSITDDEIKEQILPFIATIDEEFRKYNTELYNEIINKQQNI